MDNCENASLLTNLVALSLDIVNKAIYSVKDVYLLSKLYDLVFKMLPKEIPFESKIIHIIEWVGSPTIAIFTSLDHTFSKELVLLLSQIITFITNGEKILNNTNQLKINTYQLQKQNDKIEELQKQLQLNKESLESEILIIEDQLQNATNDKKNLETEIQKLRSQLSTVAVLHSNHVTAIREQGKNSEKARADASAALALKEEELREQTNKWRDQKRGWATQLQSLTYENDGLKAKIKELEANNGSLTNLLNSQNEDNALLSEQVSKLQSKLTDVNSFMHTERGAVMRGLEEQLAECKGRVAELECEKDYIDFGLSNKMNSNSSKIASLSPKIA